MDFGRNKVAYRCNNSFKIFKLAAPDSQVDELQLDVKLAFAVPPSSFFTFLLRRSSTGSQPLLAFCSSAA